MDRHRIEHFDKSGSWSARHRPLNDGPLCHGSMRLTMLMFVVALCAVMGCERHGPVATTASDSPTIKPAADIPRLKAGMTDAEIIRAFGLDPSSAKRELVQGKDGTSAT